MNTNEKLFLYRISPPRDAKRAARAPGQVPGTFFPKMSVSLLRVECVSKQVKERKPGG